MMLKPSQTEKKARRYYLKNEGDNKYELDERKIEADSRFDGFVCIATNNRELSEEKILSSYKQLYKIEHSFRTFKSYLETRPMFHWTQERIKTEENTRPHTKASYKQLHLNRLEEL